MISHAALAVAVGVFASTVSADVFDGGGDGTKYEDPLNWALDTVPGNNGGVLDANGDPVQAVDGNGIPIVDVNGNPVQATLNTSWNGQDVVFDTATWDFLAAGEAAGIDYLQSATEHRVQRFILGEQAGAGDTGDLSLTFDFADPAGGLRRILQTNSNSAVFGSRFGDCVVNMNSGEVNTGARTTFGARQGTGTLNITGGSFIIGRSNLQLGVSNAFVDEGGTGILNISGGLFQTRQGVAIGGTSSFNVIGSGAMEIGVGSNNSVDGEWTQLAGGVLSFAFDAGGATMILVDDVDDDGAGAQGNVTFEAGAILDLSDLGGADNTVKTVMTWEGTLTGAPTLSAASVSAGWTMEIVGNELRVQNTSLPDPAMGVVGDFNGDMMVDCTDLDGYVGNIGAAATGALEALDIDGDGFLSLEDAISVTETLIVTSNGVTGTFRGDVNCDGAVSVLGDAFALVANLNSAVTTYAQGDLNFDGQVSVLGDAFILVSNLNMSNQ